MSTPALDLRRLPIAQKQIVRRKVRSLLIRKTYLNDRVAFVHDMIDWPSGQGPNEYQTDVFGLIDSYPRVALRGPHGLGKGFVASMCVLHSWAVNDGHADWKVPITASAWLQLTNYLWPEIHKWSKLLRWDQLAREPFDERTELLDLSLKGVTGRAFSAAPADSAALEGAHAGETKEPGFLFYIFDEAKAVLDQTFDAAEGAFATEGDMKAFAASTPGPPSGRFHDLFTKRSRFADWQVRHVTKDEAIAAGRMNPAWAEARAKQWGLDSTMYKNRVEGQFAAGADDLIPLPWVEAAQDRWRALEAAGELESQGFTCVGVDPSDSGGDRTCLARRYGNVIVSLEYGSSNQGEVGQELMAVVGRVKSILEVHGGKAVIDAEGMGAGVVGRLKEQLPSARAVVFKGSMPTAFRDKSRELKFTNLRAGAYWALREMLEPDSGEQIALPPDDSLTEDLTIPRWLPANSRGQITLEPKEAIRKRLGRSTDAGDAISQAFFLSHMDVKASISTPVGIRLPM